MSRLSLLRFHSVAVVVGLILTGCHDSESLARLSNGQARDLDQRMKSARVLEGSTAKPAPPISVDYQILGEPAVGRPLQIEVTTRSRATLSGVQLEIHAEERLAMSSVSPNRNISGSRREEATARTMTVTPLAEGVLEISVLVRATLNGTSQARSIVIPIRVGSADETGSHEHLVRIDETGERVISFPVDESH